MWEMCYRYFNRSISKFVYMSFIYFIFFKDIVIYSYSQKRKGKRKYGVFFVKSICEHINVNIRKKKKCMLIYKFSYITFVFCFG